LLLEAWSSIAPAGHRLIMIGDGPDRAELERRYIRNASVIWRGSLPRSSVIETVRTSRWLVLPSLAYENFPMSVVEALSVGTPVVVPNHGAFSAMVADKENGLWFSAGNAASLAEMLQTALDADERTWCEWSSNARNKFRREYTDEENYARLLWIYQRAIACREATATRIRAQWDTSPKPVVSVPERDRPDLTRHT
jgi:glycosyltransferase involved in cell wall biosynthesis